MKPIGALLERIGASRVERGDGEADVAPLIQRGVPGLGLDVDASKYFWYHHTWADMMTMIDRADLARCVATMAVMTYMLADLDQMVPR
jgi:carboxypeptidase Q